MFVGDVADLAVDAAGREDNIVVDAVGPETYTFDELVRLVAQAIGRRLVATEGPSTGATRLSEWLDEPRATSAGSTPPSWPATTARAA